MFSPEEIRNYADTLWWGLTTARTGAFVPGDTVLIRFDLEALPLAEAVYDLCMDQGLVPVARMNPTPNMDVSFYGKGVERQITAVAAGEAPLYASLAGLVSLIAPASLTHLAGVDPKKIGQAAVSRKFLRDILERREQTGEFGWTLCAWPTAAQAECAGLSLPDYAAQIRRACFLDAPDPKAKWEDIYAQVSDIKAWLDALPIRRVHVESAGCDLRVSLGESRRWLGVSGHNIPSFEIFTSPDCRGTEGVYYADQRSYRSGNLVRGVRLHFEAGRVVRSEAEQGADFVAGQLAMDEGAARLGEFSLTDRRFSRIDAFMANTLFDENYGGVHGNCHVAVGASYSDTYAGDQSALDASAKDRLGFNDSALHWDLVNTEPKTVTAELADGTKLVIYENGEFQH